MDTLLRIFGKECELIKGDAYSMLTPMLLYRK